VHVSICLLQGTRVWVSQGADVWVPGIVVEDEHQDELVKVSLVLEEDDRAEDDTELETASGKVRPPPTTSIPPRLNFSICPSLYPSIMLLGGGDAQSWTSCP